jgi:hypothetical protein
MKILFSIQLAPSISKLGNIGHDLIWRRMEGATTVPASLLRWITPDETAAEFFRRQSREAVATGLPFIDAHVKLRPGNILELAGPAGSAKSEMLLQVRCLYTTQYLSARRGLLWHNKHAPARCFGVCRWWRTACAALPTCNQDRNKVSCHEIA